MVDIVDPFDTPPSTGIVDPFDTPAPEDERSLPGRVASAALGVGEEGARVVVSALPSLVQGIAELGAAGIDLTFGTNTSRSVTEGFDKVFGGLRPETEGGRLAEDVLAFGLGFVPVIGWLGRAGKAARAAKAGAVVPRASSRFLRTADDFGKSELGKTVLTTKPRLLATTAVAAGGYEALFSRDGRTTMVDSFDLGGPLQTEKDVGLTGREEALRRIRNKLRQGAEATLLSGAIDTGLAGLGAGARAFGASPVGLGTAKVVRGGLGAVASGFRAIPGTAALRETAVKYLTPSGGADPEVYENMMDAVTRGDAAEQYVIRAYDEFSRISKNAAGGKTGAKQLERDMSNYLDGLRGPLTEYGENVAKAADRVANSLDSFRDRFYSAVELEYERAIPNSPQAQKLKTALDQIAAFEKTNKTRLRRIFQRYNDPVAYYRDLKIEGMDIPKLSAAVAKGVPKNLSQYDAAIVEVSKHLQKEVPGAWSTPEALTLARSKVNEYIGLEGVNRNLPPEQAMRLVQEKVKSAELGTNKSLFAKATPRLRMTPTLLTPREQILDSSPKLRQLLGEVTDPQQRVYQTIGDLAKTTEALRFYRQTAESGRVASLTDAINSLSQGRRPAFVSVPDIGRSLVGFDMDPYVQEAMQLNRATAVQGPLAQGIPAEVIGSFTPEDIIARDRSLLESYGYVRLGSDDARNLGVDEFSKDIFQGPYGALTGLYVSPETYQALTAPMRIGITGIDEFFSVLTQLKALSQKMTIVPNPESQVRQIIGNAGSLVKTANLGRDTEFFDVFSQYTSSLDELDEAGLSRHARLLSLSGVTESDLIIKALEEYRAAGKDLTVSGKLHKLISKAEGLVPFMSAFEKLYSNSDSLFKGIALVSEQNKLMHSFAKAGLDPDNVPVDLLKDLRVQGVIKRTRSDIHPDLTPLEVAAADAVKDMFPIYNRVGLLVRNLDRYGLFGNFMSFASENIRNAVNILDKGLKEMTYTVSPELRQKYGEEAARALESQIRGNGSQRLFSYVAYNAIVPQAIVRGAMRATGTTEAQMEALYNLAPEYTSGQDLVPIKNTQDGVIEYYSLGGIMPHAFIFDSAKAAIRAYQESGSLGKNEAAQILDGVWAGVKAYSDPFVEQTMAVDALMDVMPKNLFGREGSTLEGVPVYNKSDPLDDKVLKSISHVINAYVPGYLREFFEVRQGDVEPGRITRAVLNMPGPQGQEFNVPAEAARLITGLTPMQLNLRRDFNFSGGVYSTRRTDAKSAAQRIIRAPDRSPAEMIDAWQTYLDVLYKEQSRLYKDIQDARTLGLSELDIRRNLTKDANIGTQEISAIMRGEFYPGLLTPETLAEIRTQAQAEGVTRITSAYEIPIQEINALSRERSREQLIFSPPAEASSAPGVPQIVDPFESAPTERQGAVMPPPAFGSAPAPSAPQMPTAPANRASVSPSLLGDSPSSILANLEIAQRPQA